jgi:VanZ family protein
MTRIAWKHVLFFWCFLILFLTLFPGNKLSGLDDLAPLQGLDLIIHFFLFMVFGFLLAGTLRFSHGRYSGKWMVSAVILCGTVFGLITEFLQAILPIQRDASVYDLLADILGGIVGAGVLVLVAKRSFKK